jgi:hypothetical protein
VIKREAFLIGVGSLELAACAGAATTPAGLLLPQRRASIASTVASGSGYTITQTISGNTLTAQINGRTFLQASYTNSPRTITATAPGYGSYTINVDSFPSGAFSAYGHTCSPGDGVVAIDGSVVNGSSSLGQVGLTTAQVRSVNASASAYQNFIVPTIQKPLGCHPTCPLAGGAYIITFKNGAADAGMGASAVSMIAAFVGLALAPEITTAIFIVALVDILASFLGMCASAYGMEEVQPEQL